MGNVNDPLVRDYVELLQIVALIHTARILSTHADPQSLLKHPELLRQELLKPEYLGNLFGSNSPMIGMAQDRPGFVISALVAKAFLERRSEQRVAQAA